jgi:hypothetical protein
VHFVVVDLARRGQLTYVEGGQELVVVAWRHPDLELHPTVPRVRSISERGAQTAAIVGLVPVIAAPRQSFGVSRIYGATPSRWVVNVPPTVVDPQTLDLVVALNLGPDVLPVGGVRVVGVLLVREDTQALQGGVGVDGVVGVESGVALDPVVTGRFLE